MWDIILDFIRDVYRKYKIPVCILILNSVVYALFGVKSVCSFRCPMPPMTTAENLLFIASHIIGLLAIMWIFIIYMTDKYNDM